LVAREREIRPGVGAVLLSEHAAIAPRLHALQLGFDDAVDLAADPIEISGRLSTAARDRSRMVTLVWVGSEVQLDLGARTLWRNGEARRLRPRDFELLRFLVDHPAKAFTRLDLLDAWPGNRASVRMIDVTIWRLRSLIEKDPASPEQFVTVPRLGYRFDPPTIRR
jgi:DNA-binding response OmpR family regulator